MGLLEKGSEEIDTQYQNIICRENVVLRKFNMNLMDVWPGCWSTECYSLFVSFEPRRVGFLTFCFHAIGIHALLCCQPDTVREQITNKNLWNKSLKCLK